MLRIENRRPTIGVLINSLFAGYEFRIWKHLVNIGELEDINLLFFSGGAVKNPDFNRKQKNILYDFITGNNVDGLISLSGVMGHYLNPGELEHFYKEKFPGLPVVNIGPPVNDCPSIMMDHRGGMEMLMKHIIVDHGCRKIAYIRGPEGYDANLRFQAYRDSLEKYGLPFNSGLVVPGDFQRTSGTEGVRLLLDERKEPFDFLLCGNDAMAIYAIKELQARGIDVPGKIGVAGFDNIREATGCTPSLTTVGQPYYDMVVAAVNALLFCLGGKQTIRETSFPAELVIRRSCGCKGSAAYNHSPEFFAPGPGNGRQVEKKKKEEKTAEILEFLGRKYHRILQGMDGERWPERLISALLEDFEASGGPSSGNFVPLLEYLVTHSFQREFDAMEWVNMMSGVFRILASCCGNRQERLEALWQEIVTAIGFLGEQVQEAAKIRKEEQVAILLMINEALMSTFHEDQLKDIFTNEIPKLGIESSYFVLYEDGRAGRVSRLFTSYNLKEEEKEDFTPFPSEDLIPGGIKKKSRRFSYIIMPLFFEEKQHGYALFEVNTVSGMIYENLAIQLSGALEGAMLLDTVQAHSRNLEEKVRERTLELEKANDQLKDMDILKNDFIANISHDFRSPLTVVLNIADLALKYNKDLDAQNREQYGLIYDSSLRLLKTVNQLLALAKLNAGEIKLFLKKMDMVSLLGNILRYYESALVSSGIRIIKNLPEKEIDDLYTDRDKFEQIINNLISNAVKFVDPRNGRITVTLEEREKDVVIRIRDNGIGIPRDKLDLIFDRFKQAHESNQGTGTGIGLAFSRQLVELLKGTISVESEGPGKGSEFRLTFPKGRKVYKDEDFCEETPASVQGNRHTHILPRVSSGSPLPEVRFGVQNREEEFDYTKGKFLIIDDDPRVREIIFRYLSARGYSNFIFASNGQEGISAVYRYTPDIIICDYNMSRMNGGEFHDHLINNPEFKEIPFIFISAIADTEIMLSRKEKGAMAYLKKPINERELGLTVEQGLKKYMEYLEQKHYASIDETTGLYNSRTIFIKLKDALETQQEGDLSLICLTLEHLKEVNDRRGRQGGNILLSRAGKLLKELLLPGEIPGRCKADQFLVIQPGHTREEGMIRAGELCAGSREQKIFFEGSPLPLSLCPGVAALKGDAAEILKALEHREEGNLQERIAHCLFEIASQRARTILKG